MPLTADFYLRRITETLLSPTQTAPEPHNREVRSDAHLLKIADDPTFLSAAYEYYLKRTPDLEGFDHFTTVLQNGEKRKTVLDTLRQSAEALYGHGTPVAAPAPRPPGEVPEEWRLIYTPKTIELDELLLIAGPRQFVEAAYRRVLRRGPDPLGLEHHVDAVLRGIPREFVLQRLCASEEARSRPDTFLLHGRDATQISPSLRLRALYRAAFPARTYLALLTADRVEAAVVAVGDRMAAIESDRRRHAEAERHAQTRALDELAARLTDAASLMTLAAKRAPRPSTTPRQDQVAPPSAGLERLEETSVNLMTKLDAIAADIETRQVGILGAVEAARASLGHVWSRVKSPVLPGGDGLLVTETGGFVVALPEEEWRLSMSLGAGNELEPGLVRCVQQLIKPGMVVVDVGANVGLLTMHAALLAGPAGTVFGFEPAPRTFAALRESLRVNGFLDGRRLVLRQVAVADRQGRAKLWTQAHNCGHDTLFRESSDDEAIEVETVALDDVLAGEPRVDVIKIDAEGAEPLIWQGMQKTLQRHPEVALLIEFAPGHLRRAGYDPGEFLNRILSSGFEMQEVHPETGELRRTTCAALQNAFSVNLYLQKARREAADDAARTRAEAAEIVRGTPR